ncbi:hypothetical protein CDAR_563171 [Caerostris darwini]|uniref:Uncharacterized protein n=1 Tax=Caerostris darwini TaxID=1538125 RepID=A0AAV4UUX1_9ARAC|nr:hypothetical protein CDAR_563171 [Caerostris darwini]
MIAVDEMGEKWDLAQRYTFIYNVWARRDRHGAFWEFSGRNKNKMGKDGEENGVSAGKHIIINNNSLHVETCMQNSMVTSSPKTPLFIHSYPCAVKFNQYSFFSVPPFILAPLK